MQDLIKEALFGPFIGLVHPLWIVNQLQVFQLLLRKEYQFHKGWISFGSRLWTERGCDCLSVDSVKTPSELKEIIGVISLA